MELKKKMVLSKEVKDLKFREGEKTVNVSYAILDKKVPKKYGRIAKLELNDDADCKWGVFIVQKLGIHFKMPKKFFEKQLNDNSDGIEFTFTVAESDAFLELIRLYKKGSSYLKDLKKKGVD